MDTSIRNDGQMFLDFAWEQFVTRVHLIAETTNRQPPTNFEPWGRPVFYGMLRLVVAELEQCQRDSADNSPELFALRLREMGEEIDRREVEDLKALADRITKKTKT
jgi:hypothetical protein